MSWVGVVGDTAIRSPGRGLLRRVPQASAAGAQAVETYLRGHGREPGSLKLAVPDPHPNRDCASSHRDRLTTPKQASDLLVAGLDIRVLTEDGELLRRLTLDPSRDYQPSGTTMSRDTQPA